VFWVRGCVRQGPADHAACAPASLP
jgi:hypothetical protein